MTQPNQSQSGTNKNANEQSQSQSRQSKPQAQQQQNISGQKRGADASHMPMAGETGESNQESGCHKT